MSSLRLARLLTILIVATALEGAQSCLAPEAVWRAHSVSDGQISPDGRSIIYVYSWNSVMDDAGYSNLRQIGIDGGRARTLTEGDFRDSSPRWSPDGARIAYISNRGGGQRIHVRVLATGEERTLAPGAEGIANLAWSPDGQSLAYMAFVPSAPDWTPVMPSKPAGAHWAAPAVAVTDLRWTFDGIGVLKPGTNHIFVVSLTGAPRQLSRDPYQHTFYVGEADLAWSRDGRSIIAPAIKGKDGWAVFDGNQIYAFPADGGEPQQLTALKGYGQQARPAPDGSRLAFVGYDWKGQTYHVGKLRLQGGSADPVLEVTTAWDRDVASPLWAADSKRIYFLSDDHGDINLYESDLTGTTRQVSQGHQRVTSLSIAGNRAAFIYSTPTEPPRLATFSLESPEKVAVLVDPNRDLMSGCTLSKAEEIRYESFDGLKIQGWLLKPPGFSATRKYPLLVSIHGGPHGSYGNSFNQELQAFADHGYVVLYVNPRGSTGYGEAFGNIIQHKWPGDDIKDVMAGADYTLKQGFTDPNRMAVIGGSGGGLMTSWILGQTDRFRAAVAMYPVTNWFTHVGSADNGFYIASVYRKGMPWDDPEDYISHSPLFYAKNFKTPTMIITGEEDWRTPMAQSQELFRALKVRGVDTVLVRVPGESHGIRRRPSHQIATMVNSLAWLDKYIEPNPR